MPKKKCKRPKTPPSDDSDGGEDEFLIDPEQIFDVLPQPFRLVDKTLNDIFDRVWSVIEGIEDEKAIKLSKENLPNYDCGRPLFDFVNPSCICSDSRGKYLFVSHNDGITVVEALIGQSLAFYEDSSARNVVKMNACVLQEGFYALATLENNGVAKLFCYFGEQLQIAKVFTDEVNKQLTVSLIQLSEDGNYVGVGWEGRESYLEVLKIPKETWIKEAESSLQSAKSKKRPSMDLQSGLEENMKAAEEQEAASVHSSNSPPSSRPESSQGTPGQSSFTKPSIVIKVRPTASIGPCAATNYAAAFKAIDSDTNAFSITNNHVLMTPYFEHSELTFKSLHQPLVKYLSEDDKEQESSTPNFHFLKPGKLVPSGLETAPSRTNSVAVWWTGGTHLLIYSLVKNAKDLEIKPDAVWPNAEQIHISAISDCLSVLALGMIDSTIAVWDVYRGILLRVLSPAINVSISCMRFISSGHSQLYDDDKPAYQSSSIPVANLAFAYDDGSFNIVQCGVGYSPPIKPLIDRSAMQQATIRSICTLPKTPQVIAACKETGQITFYDTTSFYAICHATLPSPYMVDVHSPPCLGADSQVFVLKGSCPDEDGEEEEATKSTVFTFPLQSFPSLNRYWRMAVVSEPYGIDNPIETRMNSIVQDRISSQGTRQLRMQERWQTFKDELKKIQTEKKYISTSIWLTKQMIDAKV